MPMTRLMIPVATLLDISASVANGAIAAAAVARPMIQEKEAQGTRGADQQEVHERGGQQSADGCGNHVAHGRGVAPRSVALGGEHRDVEDAAEDQDPHEGDEGCHQRGREAARPQRPGAELWPYDWDAIAALVARTNRVVVAHEDQITCGFGAEIAARIGSDLFDHLDAPIRRVGALDTPVAYCPIFRTPSCPSPPMSSRPLGNRPLLNGSPRPRCAPACSRARSRRARFERTCSNRWPPSRHTSRDGSGTWRASSGQRRPVFHLRSPEPNRVWRRRGPGERVGDRAHRQRARPDHQPGGVRRRPATGVFVVAGLPGEPRAHSGLLAGRLPHQRVFPAGPHARPRRARRPRAQRHRIAAVHGRLDPALAAGHRLSDHGILAGGHADPIVRRSRGRPATKTTRRSTWR